MARELREVTDWIVDFDPDTLQRRPVAKLPLVASLRDGGQPRAARIVEGIPADADGHLNAEAVDRLMIRIHCEIQRLSEEFQHGQRMAESLRPLVAALRRQRPDRPVRVVDIGCGTGFVVRWLTSRGGFGDEAHILGADYNEALIDEARRLAEIENIPAEFVVANAFGLDDPADVFMSTGFLHHFRGDGLQELFELHERAEASAFLHVEFQPNVFAPLGSWLFHFLRMRDPLSRHDGVVSTMRSYSARELVFAARAGAPGFDIFIYNASLFGLPRVFHTVVGIRPGLRDALVEALGRRARFLRIVAP